MNDAIESAPELARLRWRCRRGMRELDALMTGYLEKHYPAASAADQKRFRELLEWPDPDLFRFLPGKDTVQDDELMRMRGDITGAH